MTFSISEDNKEIFAGRREDLPGCQGGLGENVGPDTK